MAVGLLLITHGELGEALLASAQHILGQCPLPIAHCAVTSSEVAADVHTRLQQAWQRVNQNAGVLILTDLYGSTPSNLASLLLTQGQTRLVSGINLPMLLRVLNYPQLGLDELAVKAASGGAEGIVSLP